MGQIITLAPLAYIQAENSEEITGEEVIQFLKARTKGITMCR
jgi:hypothetical protein